MKRIPDPGIIGAAALREAAATECGQVMGLVSAALQAKLGGTNEYFGTEAMYPDRVIINQKGRYFAYPYTIGDDNQVTLGAPQEVIEQYLPVKMIEAVPDAVKPSSPFLEATDASGLTWDATLIVSGMSLNRNVYPDAVLREAVPLFDGRPIFAKGDVQHIRGEGKDVRNIIGWVSEPKFVEGATPDTGRVVGRVNLSSATNLRQVLADAWQRGKKDLAALSIDADGTATSAMREGKRVRVATKITKVNSVDLIVEPGAGGALVRMVEAANPDEEHDMSLKLKMLEAIKADNAVAYAKINPETVTDDELEVAYHEAVTAPKKPAEVPQADWDKMTLAEKKQACADALDEKSESAAVKLKEAVTPAAVTRVELRMIETRANARATIAGSNLPPAAKDKLSAAFAEREVFTEADVGAAIKGERAYLAKFTESGRVVMGGDISVEDRSLKVGTMLDAFFDVTHKDHRAARSFKECYIEITGDKHVTGRVDQMNRARLREAAGESFTESMDSTTLSSVLGNSITRRLLADYRTPNQYDVWRPISNIVPINDFRTQERTRYGGYGDLPAVLEGAAYTSLASPTDEKATYTVSKKGGTEDLTIEMIKNDDVGVIRQIPTKLSRSAKRTLGKFVMDFIRTNPNIYDGLPFFHANHGNLDTAAISAGALATRRLALLKQAEAGSADRLGIPPKFLIVPPDLQEAAVNLFNRNTNLDKTFINSMSLDILPVWYWTDVTDWALAVDPIDMPWLEVGFLDGNEEPELLVQDQPNVGSMFTNDKVTYKVRHIYGGNVTNYRGCDKSVVAG